MAKNIAIIPARGGSKRLKNKNIYPLLGKPLIAYSIEACLASKYIDQVYVSSDSGEILTIGEEYGAYSLKRKSSLADDKTPKIIAIRSAIEQLEEQKITFENVAIVQANSPEITANMIDNGFTLFFENKLWEVMSADDTGIQNAAFRIIKKEVAFQPFLSAHCGFTISNVMDVHTLEDIKILENRMKA